MDRGGVAHGGLADAQTFDDLFDPSVLRDVHLRMKAGDWDTLEEHYLEDTMYRGDFRWGDLTVPIVGIRSRGSASRNAHTPGLKISFDEYMDGQRTFGLKSIVLANGIQDPSMLKQRLGLGRARAMNGSSCRFREDSSSTAAPPHVSNPPLADRGSLRRPRLKA